MKELVKLYHFDITTYINYGLGRKSINVWSFYDFPLFLKFSLIFMNMQIR